MSPDFSQFGPRRPVRGGVEARSRRGSFGRTWWGRALVDAVEKIADAGRLSRGKSYARSGQVVAFKFGAGAVTAEVQGSQPQPFEALFTVRRFDDDEVRDLIATVRSTPGMLAEIVSGSVPKSLGPSLLPTTSSDFDFSCTCPDSGWPCKHVAAVVYLAAEQIDDRPLDILTLRGVDVETLISGVESGPDEPDSDDLYGDRTTLPKLPIVEIRPAMDDLDPAFLRKALRMTSDDEKAVSAGVRELSAIYGRIVG